MAGAEGEATMPSSRVATCVFASVLFVAGPSFALDPTVGLPQFRHRVWQASDGAFPQNSVTSIAQTPDGYLWLATQEGLTRFDGANFVTFDRSNTPAMRDTGIRSMVVDDSGGLWMSTTDGLLEMRKGRFVRHGIETGLTTNQFWWMNRGRKGRVLIPSANGLIIAENGRLSTINTERAGATRVIYGAAEDRHGAFWIVLSDRGVARLHRGKLTIYREGALSVLVNSIYADRAGDIWAGSSRGLVRFSNGKTTTWTKNDGLPGADIVHITEDSDGTMWLGTLAGLCSFHHGKFRVYTKRDGLSDDYIWTVFEDRERNLWVGTSRGGLNQYRDTPFRTWSSRDGLAGDQMLAVLEDRSGAMWIGTAGNGLSRIRNGTIKNFGPSDGLRSGFVLTLAEDHNGDIWAGTNDGLYRIRGDAVREYTIREGLADRAIWTILCDPVSGDLWIRSRGGALYRMHGDVITRYGRQQGLQAAFTQEMAVARDGALYMCSDQGLLRYHNNAFTTVVPLEAMPENCVEELIVDADGTLWGSSWSNGLVQVRDGKFAIIGASKGLPEENVFGIVDDRRGSLWLTSNRGLYRVSKREADEVVRGVRARITPTRFDTRDGLPNDECNNAFPGGWVTRAGGLWIPTAGGMAVLDLSRAPTSHHSPEPIVEQIATDSSTISHTGNLVAGTRRLRFDYTAPTFNVPEAISFRFKLDGFDDEWVDAGKRRKADYTNIPPGRYRFRVAAMTPSGAWRENATPFDITLQPFFHQTMAFRIAVIALVLSLVYLAYRLRIAAHERRERALMQIVDERTQQLRAANDRLREMSLMDALTGVANRRSFDEALHREWHRALRTGRALSLVMIDVDHFKAYNDHYGHQGGDACLQSVAAALRNTVNRSTDVVARYGGEEFAVILVDNAGDRPATFVAERLRRAVASLELPHATSSVGSHVTVSLGAATVIPQHDLTPTALIAAADAALYRSKTEGRNRVSHDGALAGVAAAA